MSGGEMLVRVAGHHTMVHLPTSFTCLEEWVWLVEGEGWEMMEAGGAIHVEAEEGDAWWMVKDEPGGWWWWNGAPYE